MTPEEFSDEFDVQVDSYRRFKQLDKKEELDSLEFNEFEKSMYLTKALEQVVVGLYTGRLNGEPFENTESARRYLSTLVKTEEETQQEGKTLTKNSYLYSTPLDALFITYEQVVFQDNECSNIIEVVPITLDEFHNIRNNPFRGPNNRRVLRLEYGGNKVELISKYPISKYIVRYLAKPSPILLQDFSNLTINKQNKKAGCELHEALHRTILDLAVAMAIQSKVGAKQQV